MAISVQCSGCGANFRAPDELAGKRVKCPKCSAVIAISGPQQQQPAAGKNAPATLAASAPAKATKIESQGTSNPKPESQRTVECLMSAATRGDIDTVRAVLSQKRSWIARILGTGITVHSMDGSHEQPLHHAASGGRIGVVSFLLDSRAAIDATNKWGQTPLHKAARAGHVAVASLLLDKGASIAAKDESGKTALHMAASNGHIAMVRLFLQRGAYREARDKHGTTALVTALESQHYDVAEELLAASGRTNLPTGEYSALLRLLVLGSVDAVRWVLEHGGDPNVTDSNGETPLHTIAGTAFWAALMPGKNPLEMLCVLLILLEAGANASAKNAAGQTALDTIHATPSLLRSATKKWASIAGTSKAEKAPLLSPLEERLVVLQRMQSTLEVSCTAPTVQQFASQAVVGTTTARIPFFRIGMIVRGVLEALRLKYPGVALTDLVGQSTHAFAFACPKCGPLNPQLIELAVSAKCLHGMNPQVTPTHAGPNVASGFKGWCPQCLSASVQASFDPSRLNLNAAKGKV